MEEAGRIQGLPNGTRRIPPGASCKSLPKYLGVVASANPSALGSTPGTPQEVLKSFLLPGGEGAIMVPSLQVRLPSFKELCGCC